MRTDFLTALVFSPVFISSDLIISYLGNLADKPSTVLMEICECSKSGATPEAQSITRGVMNLDNWNSTN